MWCLHVYIISRLKTVSCVLFFLSHSTLFSLLPPSRRYGQPSGGDEWFAEGVALSLWRSRFRDSQGQCAKDKRSSQVCLYVISHAPSSNYCAASSLWSVNDLRIFFFFVSYQVFLSSELQAAQIVRSRRVLDKEEGSPVCQELLAICATLNLPEPRGQDAAGVFSQVQDRVGLFNVVQVHLSQGHQYWPVVTLPGGSWG